MHCGDRHDVPVNCGDRFCPVCSISRRGRVRYRLSQLTKLVKPAFKYSTKFITLTQPNSSDLQAGVKQIMASFRRLRQTQFWRKYVDGGASVIEITGKKGAYHVHIHAVIHSRFIPQRLLSKMWEASSGGSIVWITRIPVAAVVSYLTKYLSKGVDVPDDDVEMSNALRGVRLFQPFGTWHSPERKIPKHKSVCKICQHSEFGLLALPWVKYFDAVTPPSPDHSALSGSPPACKSG